MSRLRLTAILIAFSSILFAACSHRSLVGTAFYCGCSVPPFGRGGCGSALGFQFDSWTCVGPADTAEVNCSEACRQEAGPASGVMLACVDDGSGVLHDEPIVHEEASFAGRCTPATAVGAHPLLASSGYDSSYWGYASERSYVFVENERDLQYIPISSGAISLYMPNGHSATGPLTFEMLRLVGTPGTKGQVIFDGNTIADFRILNAGHFSGEANPSYISPPHPGQINAYKIGSGAWLNYTLLLNGVEFSDTTSNPDNLYGYVYSVPSASIYGGMDYYFVYDGTYTVGDPGTASTLTMHLEFKYGGPSDRPPPPSLAIDTKFPGGGDANIFVVPTPAASPKAPKITYRHTWVKGKNVKDGQAVLSTSANPTFNPAKVGDKWVTLILQAEEAAVWRTLPVCLLPGGC